MSDDHSGAKTPADRIQLFLQILSWILLIVGVALIWSARPQEANLLEKRWHKEVRGEWIGGMVVWGLQLLRANLAISAGGLLFSAVRNRGMWPVALFLIAGILTLIGIGMTPDLR